MSSRRLDSEDQIDVEFFKKAVEALKEMHASGIVHRTLTLDYFYIKGSRVKLLRGRKTGSTIKESEEWEDYYDLVMTVYPRMRPDLIFEVIDVLRLVPFRSKPILAIRIWADETGLRKKVDDYLKV